MQKILLYRYIRVDGGVTVSTDKPETEYTELTRLVADDNKILTNGQTETFCVDTNNVEGWNEIDFVPSNEKLYNLR